MQKERINLVWARSPRAVTSAPLSLYSEVQNKKRKSIKTKRSSLKWDLFFSQRMGAEYTWGNCGLKKKCALMESSDNIIKSHSRLIKKIDLPSPQVHCNSWHALEKHCQIEMEGLKEKCQGQGNERRLQVPSWACISSWLSISQRDLAVTEALS